MIDQPNFNDDNKENIASIEDLKGFIDAIYSTIVDLRKGEIDVEEANSIAKLGNVALRAMTTSIGAMREFRLINKNKIIRLIDGTLEQGGPPSVGEEEREEGSQDADDAVFEEITEVEGDSGPSDK